MRVEGMMVEEEQEEDTQEVTALLEMRAGAAVAVGAVQPPMTAGEQEVLETVEIPTVLPAGTTGSALDWCQVR